MTSLSTAGGVRHLLRCCCADTLPLWGAVSAMHWPGFRAFGSLPALIQKMHKRNCPWQLALFPVTVALHYSCPRGSYVSICFNPMCAHDHKIDGGSEWEREIMCVVCGAQPRFECLESGGKCRCLGSDSHLAQDIGTWTATKPLSCTPLSEKSFTETDVCNVDTRTSL